MRIYDLEPEPSVPRPVPPYVALGDKHDGICLVVFVRCGQHSSEQLRADSGLTECWQDGDLGDANESRVGLSMPGNETDGLVLERGDQEPVLFGVPLCNVRRDAVGDGHLRVLRVKVPLVSLNLDCGELVVVRWLRRANVPS
jgi:hypothetical protein